MVEHNCGGQHIRLSLERWARLGEAVAFHEGKQFRVFGGIPGEEVVSEVVRERQDYAAALVVEVLEPSEHRTVPPCPLFGQCTGCQWQHVDYTHQLQMKQQVVEVALRSVAGFEAPPVMPTRASPDLYGYRNHARFTVGRRHGELGFVNRESRRYVAVYKCLLMDPAINNAIEQLQGKCAETSQLSIRYGVNTGDLLVQPALKRDGLPLDTGQKHYQESLCGREFRIAASSFFQVNTRQAVYMVDLVKRELDLPHDGLLVDAYAGVGVFAILLAPYVKSVVAIEESESAVRDGMANAEGLGNVRFLQGKTEEVLAQIEGTPHGVILDPPKAGCRIEALEALMDLGPQRLVYVSCEPETLARDLKVLCQGPFRLDRVQPIDMFPQTHHVECIATLSLRDQGVDVFPQPALARKEPETELVLASTSPRRRELLAGLDIGFRVVAPSASEGRRSQESVRNMVERLALAKARSVARSLASGAVVGADTMVALDGVPLGKPAGEAEARRMLLDLRGREHQVVTGVAVVDAAGRGEATGSQTSEVFMREYSDVEIEDYLASGGPLDKAGAYGVQDQTFHPADRVEGCYPNVVGLPLCLLAGLLRDVGLEMAPEALIRVPNNCSPCLLKNGP